MTEAKETFERAEHFTYYQTQQKRRSWGLTLKIIVHFKQGKTFLPLPGTVENVFEQLRNSQTAVLWRPHIDSFYTAPRGHGAAGREQDTL